MTAGLRLRLRAAAIMLAAQSAAAVASTLIMTKGFTFSPAFEIARDWFAVAVLSSVLAGLLFGDWLRRRSSRTCVLAAMTGLVCLLVAIVLAWEAAAAIESAMESPADGAGFAQQDFVLDAINMKDPGDLLSSLEAVLFVSLGFSGIVTLFVPHIAALIAGIAAWRQAGRNQAAGDPQSRNPQA